MEQSACDGALMYTHVRRRLDRQNRRLIATFIVFSLMGAPRVMADGSVGETRVSSAQPGQNIGPLLLKLEQQIAAEHVALPKSDNASETWLLVIAKAYPTTPEIRLALANFATHALNRATTERAAGREVAATEFQVFADLATDLLNKEGALTTSSEGPSASYSAGTPQVSSRSASPATGSANLRAPESGDIASPPEAAQLNRANEPPPPGGPAAPGMSWSADGSGATATRQLAPTSQAALTVGPGPSAPVGVLNSAPAGRDGGNTAHPTADIGQTPLAPTPPAPPATTPITPVPTIQNQSLAALYATRGDQMLAIKDVSAARRLYEYAANAGSARAAAALARTFDPSFLSRLGVVGLKPDPALAAVWYGKAVALGDRDADALLRNLNTEAAK
jgi:hypothetical protein